MGPILQGRGKLRHTKTERAAYVQSSTSQDNMICFRFCILGNPRMSLPEGTQTHRFKLLTWQKGNCSPDSSGGGTVGKIKSDFVSQAFIHPFVQSPIS